MTLDPHHAPRRTAGDRRPLALPHAIPRVSNRTGLEGDLCGCLCGSSDRPDAQNPTRAQPANSGIGAKE